jgi:DNA polymerase
VGAAGSFLSELLAAAGLAREDVYICNVLKCRPPGNRDPLPNEIDACRDYLDEQIDLIDPLIIVTLGRFSMARYFPRQAISRVHGQVREVAGRYYVPMYHPAAALHQGNLKAVMLRDFSRLGDLLEQLRGEATPAAVQAAKAVMEAGVAPDRVSLREEPDPTDFAATAPMAAESPTTQIRLFD